MAESVEFEAKCIRETEFALLVEIDGEEVWMPKSQIQDESEVTEPGDEGALVVTEWIAREKNLI